MRARLHLAEFSELEAAGSAVANPQLPGQCTHRAVGDRESSLLAKIVDVPLLAAGIEVDRSVGDGRRRHTRATGERGQGKRAQQAGGGQSGAGGRHRAVLACHGSAGRRWCQSVTC